METKVCRKCGKEAPATREYFCANKKGKYGLREICKDCSEEYNREYQDANREELKRKKSKYYKDNIEKVRERNRVYRKQNLDLIRARRLQRIYSISEHLIQEMMNIQKGCCAICGISLVSPDSERAYVIDHCHRTGAIRGLLCNKCNSALGFFDDCPDIIQSAADYLRKYNG